MYMPNTVTLRLLRHAVKTRRAARQALTDLSCSLSENCLSEQMEARLEEEVKDIELDDGRGVPITLETLAHLIQTLSEEAP